MIYITIIDDNTFREYWIKSGGVDEEILMEDILPQLEFIAKDISIKPLDIPAAI